MKLVDLRHRILLWYGLSVFFVAAVIFAGFYLVTRQILFQQVDKELNLHAQKLVEIASRQGLNMHEAMLRQQLVEEFSNIPGMVVVLLDENGSLVRSSLTGNNPYPAFSRLYQQARNTSGPVFLNQNINNLPLRFIGLPITANDNFFGVVLVAHPVEAIQKSLNQLSRTLLLIFGVLIVPLGLYFNRILERLQRMFDRERQFLGDVAHELKTPLATLTGGLELALSKKRHIDSYRQTLTGSLIDAQRLSSTVKNVLDLAWLEADNARPDFKTFNLSESMLELKEIGQKLAAQKGIKFKAKIAPDIYIIGSREKIIRAVMNIIDNAVKFTPRGQSIKLKLDCQSDRAVISVSDTGSGIAPKDLPHIFERFYRGQTSVSGSGLGLAIAKGIVASHKGEIKVASEAGKGTRVTIVL